MPHSISNKPNSVILSSRLSDITIVPDGPHFDVKLSYVAHTLLQERYYGQADIPLTLDLRDIVEDFMLRSELSYAQFTLLVGSDSAIDDRVTFSVIFCDKLILQEGAEAIIQDSFMTSLTSRRVAPDQPLLLSYFAAQDSSKAYTLTVGYELNGAIDSKSKTFNNAISTLLDGVYPIDIPPETIAGIVPADAELRFIKVQAGSRSAYFYVDHNLALGQSFIFRNCFNAPEVITIPAKTVTKTEMEQSEAVVDGVTLQYDRRSSTSYEAETGPLSFAEAEWAGQFLTSPEIFRIEKDGLMPVIITSFTSEISDGDEAPASLKFTWRYSANRTAIRIPSSSAGIFTNQFDKSFT